jgi:[acyl-carrier-protein] S-malonyltransferase
MSKTAFVFPGQGSQFVGMGKDLFDQFDIAREIYLKADRILDMPLSRISFEGPADILRETHITQPALYVHSYILIQLIGDSITADVTAGHSLGEYSANAYAKSFSFEDGLELVKKRSKLMKDSGIARPGTMAAIIGLTAGQVDKICEEASTGKELVEAANYNCPGQIVISGDINAVHKAMEIAKNPPYNCRLVKELEVSGAFHSELMLSATEELRMEIYETKINDAVIPVFTNVEAEPVQSADIIRDALFRQLLASVKWQNIIENMIGDFNVTKFYEIGAGKVLTGLIKKINPGVELHNISSAEDIHKVKSKNAV